MEHVKNQYRKELNDANFSAKRIKSRMRWLGTFRLIDFLVLVAGVFVVIPKFLLPGIGLVALTFVLFFVLLKLFQRLADRYEHQLQLIAIFEIELNVLEHNYSMLDSGSEFIDSSHPYSYDMDLFGEGSLFQYINRTVTYRGNQLLAKILAQGKNVKPEIIMTQMAVRELSGLRELKFNFRAIGKRLGDCKEDVDSLQNWLLTPKQISGSAFWRITLWALPIITILSVAGIFFIDGISGFALILYLLQFILIGFKARYTSQEHNLIGKRLDAIRKYSRLSAKFAMHEFQSEKLKNLQADLFGGESSAPNAIKRLSKIVSAFDSRSNFVAALFLEGFLLWDIQCLYRLERWKTREGKHLGRWIDALAEWDVLISLATYAANNPDYAYPLVSDESVIDARAMGHVLLPSHQRVCNDFTLLYSNEFCIITGANMAGKSTFLRTVATNLILASAGAPVCAKSVVFKPMQLFSSMRTSDSLNKNESYFYAELKRLKEMLDRMHAGEELFIILDEILKGTNSLDKQEGSKAILKQIIHLGGTGIIATHDLELTRLEQHFPGKIINSCFEIEINGAEISFDYKLLPGVTTKMNASLLMKQMGIEM